MNVSAVLLSLSAQAAVGGRTRAAEAPPADRRTVRVLGLLLVAALAGFALLAQEFGVLVEDPRGFVFPTRLASPEALVAADSAVSEADVERLRLETPFSYDRYLREHPGTARPFLHELRVRWNRRDRRLGQYLDAAERAGETGPIAGHAEALRARRTHAAAFSRAWLKERFGDDLDASDDLRRGWLAWNADTPPEWAGAFWTAHIADAESRAGAPAAEADRLADLRIAERENRILEAYFGRTLARAGGRWSDDFLGDLHARLAAHAPAETYRSPVGEDVVVRLPRSTVVLLAAAAALLLLRAPGAVARMDAAAVAALASIVLYAAWVRPVLLFAPAAPTLEAIRAEIPAAEADALPLVPAADVGRDGRMSFTFHDNAPGDADEPAAPAPATGARVLFDDRVLIVSFACTDTDVVATLAGRDSDLWTEDAVEVFVDTEGLGQSYAEIEVSPAGAVFDAAIRFGRPIDFDAARRWDAPGLHVETGRPPGGWHAEIEIPWSDLGLAGPPKSLRLGLYRIDSDSAGRKRYLAWSPTRDWFHRPWRFGLLRIARGRSP